MKKRLAVICIIVKDIESVPIINKLLSEYGNYIIGRMGLPHYKRKINIITVIIEAPLDVIDTLKSKIENLEDINAKMEIIL